MSIKNLLLQKRFQLSNESNEIGLAVTGNCFQSKEVCLSTIHLQNRTYYDVKLHVLKDLLIDVIVGQDILRLHDHVLFNFGGPRPSLCINALKCIKTNVVPQLFEHLASDCKPIIMKLRKHSLENKKFIADTIKNDLKKGIIEPSSSLWRAQVLVVTGNNYKKRMCIDYGEATNKYTLLDGYPLPNMQNLENKVAQYLHFSTSDLKSAYHQVKIPIEDRPYTAFEANGKLFQSKIISFGLTNAVPWFQRIIDDITERNNCKGTFAYLDNITTCGKTKEERDANFQQFLEAAAKHNLTFNKRTYSSDCISLLGYQIHDLALCPHPERVKSLFDMPVPKIKKELSRAIGLFAYYAKWLSHFSCKLKPPVESRTFP